MTFRIICAGFALLFLFSGAVQWNDPDPFGWIAVYTAIAAVSAATALGAHPRLITALLFGGVAIAFAMWAPALQHTSLQALQSYGMSGSIEEEEVREAIGLAIAAAWLLVLLLVLFRNARPLAR